MPTIQLENCIKCLLCVKDCPSIAIDIESGTINDSCIHCGHCVAICPEAAVYPDMDREIIKLEPSGIRPADFQNLSAGIRTCRSYLDREPDGETLELLMENMKHYPSASNARPIEIIVVRSRELVEKLNDRTIQTLLNSVRLITSPLLMPVLKRLAPKMGLDRLASYKKQFEARQTPGASLICHHAPSVLLFHAPVNKLGMTHADAYIWATYTSLFASTLGLGTCFNGFIAIAMQRSKSLRRDFNIPDTHQVYAALLLGYPKVKYTNETGRGKPTVTLL